MGLRWGVRGERMELFQSDGVPIAYMVVLLLTTVGLAAIYLDIADPLTF